ncbi:MAG TPA: glycoside hydrolase family 15 protein [Acidimicrobiales bacterium]|nr:glycoside hydrolase family 15 protein [Acidimicrobiales bacterium]
MPEGRRTQRGRSGRRGQGPPEPVPNQLRDYALVADGHRGALVGPGGAFAWMCFPTWDSPAVFSELIGGPGHYSVTPVGRFVWGGYYEEGGLVWRSRWVLTDGIVESREALVMPARSDRAVLLRRIVGVAGAGRVSVVLCPRAGYGDKPFRSVRREAGLWTGRTGDLFVRWGGAPRAADEPDGHSGRRLVTSVPFSEGSQHDLVLELATAPFDEPPADPDALWPATTSHWASVLPSFEAVVARRDVRHSYCVLTGLTSPGGGTVAAATTSLPERARRGRSYDYRYVWIRDQCFIGQAAAAGGAHDLLDDSVSFVTARLLEHGRSLRPAYTPDGGAIPGPESLNLSGYPGGTDVVGNHVNTQFQLDAFGESLLLLAAAARADRLDGDGWRAVEVAVDAIGRRWEEPDAGIWELDDRLWTHSRLACVSGLRAICAAGAPAGEVGPWTALADAILARTAATSVHPDGRWQRAPDDERVDAALLLAPIRGGLSWDDPRSTRTLEAVEKELTRDGFAYRFRPDERPLGDSEGAFLLCGFLLSIAHLQRGDPVRAVRWFERNRTASGPAGLLSEEFDVDERQQRGNLPQAFVHAVLMEAAFRQTDAGIAP